MPRRSSKHAELGSPSAEPSVESWVTSRGTTARRGSAAVTSKSSYAASATNPSTSLAPGAAESLRTIRRAGTPHAFELDARDAGGEEPRPRSLGQGVRVARTAVRRVHELAPPCRLGAGLHILERGGMFHVRPCGGHSGSLVGTSSTGRLARLVVPRSRQSIGGAPCNWPAVSSTLPTLQTFHSSFAA